MTSPLQRATGAASRIARYGAVVALSVVLTARPLFAQMTIVGRVMAESGPVQGASVAIPELRLETRTISDGSYSLLIRAQQVQGQTVTMTARHRQLGQQSQRVPLTGGSLEINFTLSKTEPQRPPVRPNEPPARARTPAAPQAVPRQLQRGRAVDSTALNSAAGGPHDLAMALSGRIPGLLVTGAATPGGSSLMVFRGARSFSGSIQPLVVIDGVPIDNTGFTTASQAIGLGGFDYGNPLQDIAVDDIASVTLLNRPDASALYGTRAANGVLQVTTKGGGTTRGFSFSPHVAYATEGVTRLPSYQNRYGQGSGGQFEFFDGSGGGINDAVEESWGPALLGQPIVQASLTEPRRPDVRSWIPRPSNVGDYFRSAQTVDANAALQGAGDLGSLRASLSFLQARGVTPGSATSRIGLMLNGASRPSTGFSATGTVRAVGARASDRPGAGFDEVNPVAGFTRMGRQVDVNALRANIRDSVEQINWIYTDRNNPFFQAIANSNDDHRGHIIGGAALTYGATTRLSSTLRVGTDNYHESRNLQVAPGWKGGYPTPLGRGDFSGGGTQQQKRSAAERIATLSFDADLGTVGGMRARTIAGVETRTNSFKTTDAISDSTAGTARVTTGAVAAGDANVTSFFALGSVSRADYLQIEAGARVERSSSLPNASDLSVFPSIGVSYDLAKRVASLSEGMGLGAALLGVNWWRAGNPVTPRSLANAYNGASLATSSALGIPADGVRGPERTAGFEATANLATRGGRTGLDLTWYHERSSDLIVALQGFSSSALTTQRGELSNTGVEAELSLVPYTSGSDVWEVVASIARNSSKVERVDGGVSAAALGPSVWGATLEARTGSPAGAIVGTRYLRDAATGALALKNGLPLADASGFFVLGSWQPDWSTSVRSRLRWGNKALDLLFDARIGGEIFSATNLWGSYAGTLSSTVAGRDSGIVVSGVDSATGTPNTTKVSVEDYFHALGEIHEAWTYSASYAKLRDARLTYDFSLRLLPGFREQVGRLSLVGRNLLTWAKAPNIDPETALSVGPLQGFEMGQLPTTRSFGVQLSISP